MRFKFRRSNLLALSNALALAACAALSGLAQAACAAPEGGAAGREEKTAQARPSPAPPQASPAQEAEAPKPAAVPARLTAADVAKLRWIEGDWRGTGDVDKPFFERYRVEPGAVVVEGFEDETFAKSTGVTRFELKDGEMGGGNEGWRWVVTELGDEAVTFGPVTKARNSFRWERVSADEWRAVLEWPAAGDRPARRRVYKMERWPRPADRKD